MTLTTSYWPADTSDEVRDTTIGTVLREAAAGMEETFAISLAGTTLAFPFMLVLMALVTTFITGPALSWIERGRSRSALRPATSEPVSEPPA